MAAGAVVEAAHGRQAAHAHARSLDEFYIERRRRSSIPCPSIHIWQAIIHVIIHSRRRSRSSTATAGWRPLAGRAAGIGRRTARRNHDGRDGAG